MPFEIGNKLYQVTGIFIKIPMTIFGILSEKYILEILTLK